MQFDGQKPLHELIVTKIAETKGRDVTEVEPLYQSIDPEAVEALFDHPQQSVSKLIFTHADCQVTIDSGEKIEIHISHSSGNQK